MLDVFDSSVPWYSVDVVGLLLYEKLLFSGGGIGSLLYKTKQKQIDKFTNQKVSKMSFIYSGHGMGAGPFFTFVVLNSYQVAKLSLSTAKTKRKILRGNVKGAHSSIIMDE